MGVGFVAYDSIKCMAFILPKRRIMVQKITALVIGLQLVTAILAQVPQLEFQQLATGLSSPLDIVSANDGTNRLFIVQRGSSNTGSADIRIYANGSLLPTPFLTVTGISCCGERGLLSMVFHPNYEVNRTFFVFYTAPDGALTIARYQTSAGTPNQADPSTKQIILSIPHNQNTNHNGGKLIYGTDGFLYLGTGDGGGSNNQYLQAQNPATLLGKMLRIDPNINASVPPFFTIPASNPYASDGDGIANEIIAMGLRNPWRWSFDRQTGTMWIADVGQGNREEVNFRPSNGFLGLNYGWQCWEGTLPTPNVSNCTLYNNQTHTQPVFEYPHNSTGGFSITGGFVYRGNAFSILKGWYVCADYVLQNAFLVNADNGLFTSARQGTGIPANISSFGEDEQGELYAVSLTGGILYRVTAAQALPLRLIDFSGSSSNGTHLLQWQATGEEAGDVYELEMRKATEGSFTRLVRIQSTNAGSYRQVFPAGNEEHFYRLKIVHANGAVSYSAQVVLGARPTGRWTAYSSAGNINLVLPEKAQQWRIADLNGKQVAAGSTTANSRSIRIDLRHLRRQLVIVEVFTPQGKQSQKLWVE
jgi:glucose/arabinose dehydrogenase